MGLKDIMRKLEERRMMNCYFDSLNIKKVNKKYERIELTSRYIIVKQMGSRGSENANGRELPN